MTTVPLTVKGAEEGRLRRDRRELLETLLRAPGCEDFYRHPVLRVPPRHPVYWWRCEVTDCQCVAKVGGLCAEHTIEWPKQRAAGMSRREFVTSAAPVEKFIGVPPSECRICPGRPAKVKAAGLCSRHWTLWHRERTRTEVVLEDWVKEQVAFRPFGGCCVHTCTELAGSPLGLCDNHVRHYTLDGRPGGARLPKDWFRTLEPRGLPVPVLCDDEVTFRRWCSTRDPVWRAGTVNLIGIHPLLRAELQWGMYTHAQVRNGTRWELSSIQLLATLCRTRGVTSLFELTQDEHRHAAFREASSTRVTMMLREISDALRTVYFSPGDAREAGFIETDHFGRRFPHSRSHYDLTGIRQRWLRDMVWDSMAETLQSPRSPRTRGPFDSKRRAAMELGAFLEIDAPGGGHDPTLLRAEHAERFVAEYRRRSREGLPTLALSRADKKTSVVTETGRRFVFNHLRAMAFAALEAGRTEQIGLHASFVTALPPGGTDLKRSRAPFTDDMARALTDEGNLERLASEHDSRDRGVRDIWEAIIFTGRRSGEIISLRLDSIGRYRGLPLLWHDQTKVGRYDQAVRIPERLYDRLDARRTTTLRRFEDRHGRVPSAAERARMALFVTHVRNPHFERHISYTSFLSAFSPWVASLDLGPAVPHQARHTMATRLLDAGASLTHIRQFLGHVSDRMAEHYVHITDKSLDSVLQTVWVAGPGAHEPGALLSTDHAPLTREEATALALDLTHRSTPTEGGFCTFQPVVNGSACPWKLNCEGCDHFVLSGADLLYWRRKQEQWRSIAERAPDDATADYLHQVFEPTARALAGLERALAGLGLLEQALNLDLRRPQDYFQRIWNTTFSAADLAEIATGAGRPTASNEGLPA